MAISSKFASASWSPSLEASRGRLAFRIAGSDIPASGRANQFTINSGGYLVAPTNEGSRAGDGTPLSDPYGYENDGVTSVDYRPIPVSGIVPGKIALGCTPSRGGGLAGVGNFVDDPNTGAASQAPATPGKMLIASTDQNGNDQGIQPTDILMPKTTLFIYRFDSQPFNPIVDLNGAAASGDQPVNNYFLQSDRITTGDGIPAGFYVVILDSPPAAGEWGAVIYRKEVSGIVAYSAVTGKVLGTSEFGNYVEDIPVTGIPAVHTVGGRRYNQAGATPAFLRQRSFGGCRIQEVTCVDRLVDPGLVAKWVRLIYPGIENVAVTQ